MKNMHSFTEIMCEIISARAEMRELTGNAWHVCDGRSTLPTEHSGAIGLHCGLCCWKLSVRLSHSVEMDKHIIKVFSLLDKHG